MAKAKKTIELALEEYSSVTKAVVTVGESIHIDHNCKHYGRTVNTFKVGDVAIYDFINFDFTGTIVSITATNVIVKEPYTDGRKHYMKHAQFTRMNESFNLDKISEHRANWTD
jgi:hypothetical protein